MSVVHCCVISVCDSLQNRQMCCSRVASEQLINAQLIYGHMQDAQNPERGGLLHEARGNR